MDGRVCGDGGSGGVAVAAPFRRRGSNGAARAPGRYKRPFDLALLAAAGLALAPLWVVGWVAVALAIRLEDGGPVLYRQRRVGRDGRTFEIVKFRTMAVDAERQTGRCWRARATRTRRWGACCGGSMWTSWRRR